MVLLLDLNFSPPEKEDNHQQEVPDGGNAAHSEEEDGIDEHAHEDVGTLLSLQINGWHYNLLHKKTQLINLLLCACLIIGEMNHLK